MKMIDKVKEILSHYTEMDILEITETSNLVLDLGLNSFDTLNAVVEFEDEFNVEIHDEDIRELQTVKDVCDYINKIIH